MSKEEEKKEILALDAETLLNSEMHELKGGYTDCSSSCAQSCSSSCSKSKSM
ncbi:MAG: hypothetical protein KBH21_05330 [Acetoanaerobium sp.]|nr:hypothetical protein [Acetoanaerobium sp.]